MLLPSSCNSKLKCSAYFFHTFSLVCATLSYQIAERLHIKTALTTPVVLNTPSRN